MFKKRKWELDADSIERTRLKEHLDLNFEIKTVKT